MKSALIKALKVYPTGKRLVVYVPDRRGEELRLHLLSHGIKAKIGPASGTPYERLEVEGDKDAETLQAILDHWER